MVVHAAALRAVEADRTRISTNQYRGALTTIGSKYLRAFWGGKGCRGLLARRHPVDSWSPPDSQE